MACERETDFRLIETMRWSAEEGYYLLQRHLDRLAASARYFGMECDIKAVRAALEREAGTLGGMQCVRLLLGCDGSFSVTAAPILAPNPEAVLSYAISERRVDSGDGHRRHKTTRREILDRERERLAAKTGCDEAIFVNERGELTEGSYTNLFVERGGKLLTPPLSCGLLDGTLRRELLEDPSGRLIEQVLYPHDLEEADAVFLGNSVRGLLRARRVA